MIAHPGRTAQPSPGLALGHHHGNDEPGSRRNVQKARAGGVGGRQYGSCRRRDTVHNRLAADVDEPWS